MFNQTDFNSTVIGNNNNVENEMNVDVNMMQNGQMDNTQMGGCCNTISETPQVRCGS